MKALVGAWDHTPQKLLAEITALRTKVAQLTAELADLRAENAMLRELRGAASEELASTSV
jgi:regulator of replication initiation timing